MTCKRTHLSRIFSVFSLSLVLSFWVAVPTPDALAQPLFVFAGGYGTGGYVADFVAVADVNGDGKPDLIVANYDTNTTGVLNTIGVLLGNGDGTFQPVMLFPSGGSGPVSIAVVDVNGDGKPDLVVMNQGPCYACSGDGIVSILLGKGDGTFDLAYTYDVGGGVGPPGPYGGPNPGQMAVADVNNDGKLDIVVASCVPSKAKPGGSVFLCGFVDGVVSVLLGNGDGTFQSPLIFDSGGLVANTVAVADVNADGKPDILVANGQCTFFEQCSNGLVGVLLGNGDGTFHTAKTYGSGGWRAGQIAIADVNNDGKLDLIVGNCGGSNCWVPDGVVGILLGNGDGTFQPAVSYDSGGPLADAIAVADVNGDGKLDVVAGNFIGSTVGVLLGNGDGTFRPPVIFASRGGFTSSVAIADVNNDKRPDLLVTSVNGLVEVLLNNISGGVPPF